MLSIFGRWFRGSGKASAEPKATPASEAPAAPPSQPAAPQPAKPVAAALPQVVAPVKAPAAPKASVSSTHPASSTGEKPTMTKYKLEYIWLDGYSPTPNLRGKTQIKAYESFPTLEQLPLWG